MNFKKYHVSKNLFDPNSTRYHMGKGSNNQIAPFSNGAMFYIEAESNMRYTIKVHTTDSTFVRLYLSNAPIVENVVKSYNVISESETIMNPEVTISNTDYAYLWIQIGGAWYTEHGGSSIMLNTGSTPLPYEPYSSEVWHNIPHYIHNTATDTITTLPADIYANDTTATIGLKGNMVQTGTPSPTTPIQPSECGDLETSGAKASQYKIPILSNSTTTPVYLGEVESTRKVKKLVLDGTENWRYSTSSQAHWIENVPNDYDNTLISQITTVCTHYKCIRNDTGFAGMVNGDLRLYAKDTSPIAHELYIKDETFISAADFKTYLRQQYAAGTPVTVWYVLATETTGIVNEPIRKIGNYADTISGISIPTISGADSFDVLTTLKPSEVSLSYTGWHDATVGEWDGSQWQ